eukprot:GHVS01075330.1.p1 GENE.GHVS01075330.1~~GHVS01075330.1.p1  ORF type:complete len:145 (+),score=27.53 GHVS01075330.1:211-645(+)
MGTSVQPSRFLDGAILSLFVLLLSALSLYLFGEFWSLSQHPRFSKWNIGLIMQKLFPFKKSFDFNLTHILLMSICILMLSLKPDLSSSGESEEHRVKKQQQRGRGSRASARVEDIISDDEDDVVVGGGGGARYRGKKGTTSTGQ